MMIMEALCDQAIESLDHTAQKEKGELAQRGKLGKRRRPSRASLKAQLTTSTLTEEDEIQTASGKKSKDENVNFDQEQTNSGLNSTEYNFHEDHPIIKQGPKGTVIEIGSKRNPDASTVICINYPKEENACHTRAVITGAILKTPSERRLSKMAGIVDYSNGVEPEVEESEEENEEADCKRWKSLPSLWQAAKCKAPKKEQTKEEEEAPWTHEVKLRHVEDPECVHRGCSMLFFGPLAKSHQSPTGKRRDTSGSGSDSQSPDTQHNGTEVIYRPIRQRPSSVCDQVQIQTWDRRHLTTSSRTNVNNAQQKCELQRNGVINLETDALLLSDVVVQTDKPATGSDIAVVKEPTIYKRPKPKKRWKLDAMDNGVQRSKSLNGIDRSDQPEWIELSRRLTSRNIDWDNLPTIKGGSTGRNLQKELKLAWKIKGTEQKAENYLRSDGKEEIVLSKEELAVIPNGFTKLSKAARWEKLDFNANISQRQKSNVPNSIQNSTECQKNRALPHQPSAQEEAISWIKEAEKRRQKYMDWQSQESTKSSEETANQKPPKVPKEIIVTRHVSTPPEIVSRPKNTPTKLPSNEQLDPLPMPITEERVSDFNKEEKIKDAVREELSLFSVKLRRVRCAKPEECFHEVKCQPMSDGNQQSPEPKAIVVPTITQPPVPSPRTKKPRKVEPEVIPKDAEPKPIEECTPRASFSVQVSEQESDDFFIVINDQDDDSFLQIKSPQVTTNKKLSTSVIEKNTTFDQSGVNDITTTNERQEEQNLLFGPLIGERYESGTALTKDRCDANVLPTTDQSSDAPNSNHTVAMETPIDSRPLLTTENDSFKTMETMFRNLTCENQPESIIDIDLNANEHVKNGVEKEEVPRELVNGDVPKGDSPSNCINAATDTKDITVVHNGVIIENGDEDTECVYGEIQNIPNGIILHENNYLNLNGHRNNRKQETAEEKAARMTSEICGVLSSLGNRKTEAEKLALHMDILTTLTCPNAVCPKNASSRTMTFVTCNGEGAADQAQVCGPHSVGVQTNGIEMRDSKMPDKVQKKSQTRIKKKTVKIIIHECDDEDEKQEVVEEIVEEILEPRSQKGRMVKTPSTISRTIAEAEDGSKYLTTTVTDNCVFRPEDAT